MAIIPLRQYNREIEGLIDAGQHDEAAAHCRHILKTFPKHIATYRLLGKAYLEQQRYADASDIFQRVLSSVPDDYVSNIGMSIIREDEGNLDAAIWYMERAFESQPSNAAIKEELRRLFGRRDGIEPPKIRLTRGALARMYARGGLNEQAISELRAALAEDPQRPDLLVLLAQMYFQTGQQVEAVDTCGNLVKRLPYCLVANRILAAILPRTERAEDTKTYQNRAIALDPYFSTAAPNALTTDLIPESTISIEKLTYKPGSPAEGPSQPTWAASLGIAFEEEQAQQMPEWLQDQSSATTIPPAEISTPQTAEISNWKIPTDETKPPETTHASEDVIPEWMKEAGWQPAAGLSSEQKDLPEIEPDTGKSENEAIKGDIPDWLKGLAPSGIFDEEEPPTEGGPVETELPWLQKTTPGASDTIVNWLGANKASAAGTGVPEEIPEVEIPDWLKDLNPPTPKPEVSATGEESVDLPVELPDDSAALPEWLKGVESSYGSSGITDWLKRHQVEEYEDKSDQENSTIPEEELPVELKEMMDTASKEIDQAPAETIEQELFTPVEESHDRIMDTIEPQREAVEPPGLIDQVAALDWAESLAAGPGKKSEEPVIKSAIPSAELPDEGKFGDEEITADEVTPTQPIPLDVAAVPTEEIPEWLNELTAPTPELAEPAPIEPIELEPALPAEEIPDWLRELAPPALEPTKLSPTESMDKEPPQHEGDIPDWLKETGKLASQITGSAQVESLGGGQPTPDIEFADEASALAWLESLAAQHGAKEEELTTRPEERIDEMPDWVKLEAKVAKTSDEIPTQPVKVAVPAQPAEELPEWLKEMAETVEITPAETITEEPAQPAEELPEWLKEITEPVEIAPAEAITKEPALPAEELPEWFKEITEPVEIASAEAITEEPAQPAEELPEWLKEITEPIESVEVAPAEPNVEEPELLVAPEEKPSPALDFTDEDSALAWLENLAAQHGAKEEELITKPDERIEKMPEWIRLEAEEAQPQEILPAESISEAVKPLIEEIPDYLQESGEPTSAPSESGPTEPIEELPDWLRETKASAEIDQFPEATIEPTDEIPDWLKEIAPSTTEGVGEEVAEPMEGLADWLKEVDQAVPGEVEAFQASATSVAPSWIPEAILPEPAQTDQPEPAPKILAPVEVEPVVPEPQPIPIKPLPEPMNINLASLSQLEELPGVGFVVAQNIIAYRENNGPFTSLEDLERVPGVDQALLNELSERLTTGVPTPTPEEIAVFETEDTIFSAARKAVDQGEVSQASELYTRLIAQGADLAQVITDMQNALYHHPLDINFWIILGDAYLRTDKLQEALDAYTEAEELLR